MFPRWLPLYLLGIAALTLFPFSGPECPRPGWVMRFAAVDFWANVAAFVPIGMALYRSRFARTLMLAFGLSLTIELCQKWLPRQQDVGDLVSNTSGALLGWVVARYWTARWPGPLLRPVTRRLLLWAAALSVVLAVGYQALSSRGHDFSNWAAFPLVVGNSAYGDRPWMGDVSELAIYDRPLRPGEEPGLASPDGSPVLWAEGGPILWVRFADEDPHGRIDGPGGPVVFTPRVGDSTLLTDRGLTLLPSGIAFEPWVSDHVTASLREAGQMSLIVRLRPHVLRQHGPARIVALGDGGRFRNFMLAQRGSLYVARLRTPSNGRGGTIAEVETAPGTVKLQEQVLRLVYDGSDGQLWVDGVCEDDSPIAIGTAPLLVGPLLGVSIVVCTALGGLGLAAVTRRRGLRLLLTAVGGAAMWSLLWWLGAWAYLPGFGFEAKLLGIASVAATVPILVLRR
jgi:hypothetical protein